MNQLNNPVLNQIKQVTKCQVPLHFDTDSYETPSVKFEALPASFVAQCAHYGLAHHGIDNPTQIKPFKV
jgi:hypothetical protein